MSASRCPICNGIGYTQDQIEMYALEANEETVEKLESTAQILRDKVYSSENSAANICIEANYLKVVKPIPGCHACNGKGWINHG